MSDRNNQQESISGTDAEVSSQSISPSNSSQTRQNLSNVVQMRQQRSPWQIFKSFCFRMLMIYLVTRFIRQPTGRELKSNVNSTHSVNPHRTYKLKNLYNPGDSIDVYVFVNEEKLYQFRPNEVPTWKIVNFKYVDWTADGALIKFVEFSISENVQNNGSVYVHVVVTKHGHSIDPADRQKDSPNFSFSKSKRLNKYKRKTYPQTKNLLTNSMGKTDDEKKKTLNIEPIRSHWHSNITISFVDDQSSWRRGHVPPPIDRYLRFEETTGKFYPIVFVNDYWNLLTDYFPINSTFEKLNLTIRLEPIQLWKWEFFISQNARQPWPLNLFADENEDQDVFKRILLETNFYVLIVTIVVSLVHSIFEFLALKNEIQFWKTRQNFEGLSIRSLTFKIIQSFVVLLYVIDQRANAVVRIAVFISLFIEIWKIRKIFSFQREDEKWFSLIPKYKILIEKNYQETKSSEYDRMAFKYLSWLLFPLVLISAGYQLVFYEQKNWFSFCLSTIYGFFLAFGFIMMTPQLFINYKLKSVGHLPWRMMTYKALNTFIDDLFAFVVEMPTIYRLACFRDDLIFLIYLYQRYIYPVDRKRLNEFGQTGENESNHVEEKETNLSEHIKSD